MPFASPEEVFEEIGALIPNFAGITYERLDEEGGLQWPCPSEDHPGTPYPAQGQVHARQGPAARHPLPAAGGAVRRRVPDAAHHRPHARTTTTSRRASPRASTMLRPHELAEVSPGRRRAARLRGRRDDPRELAARLHHDAHPRHRQGRRPGTMFMTVPLQGVAGQRAHQLRRRPGHQDRRVQGVRGQDGEAGPVRPGLVGAPDAAGTRGQAARRAAGLIPLHDDVPTRRFAVVTLGHHPAQRRGVRLRAHAAALRHDARRLLRQGRRHALRAGARPRRAAGRPRAVVGDALHQHVHPRRLAPPHLQHAVPVDLRQQRRRRSRARALPRLLPRLRPRGHRRRRCSPTPGRRRR